MRDYNVVIYIFGREELDIEADGPAGASDTALAPEDLSRRRAFERLGDAIAMMASEEHPLVVTDSAVRRIRVLQQKESRPEASLRLRIIAGGCSGMQYRMDLADAPRTTDLVVSTQDVRVLVSGCDGVLCCSSVAQFYQLQLLQPKRLPTLLQFSVCGNVQGE